jgi:hypothetical protein
MNRRAFLSQMMAVGLLVAVPLVGATETASAAEQAVEANPEKPPTKQFTLLGNSPYWFWLAHSSRAARASVCIMGSIGNWRWSRGLASSS